MYNSVHKSSNLYPRIVVVVVIFLFIIWLFYPASLRWIIDSFEGKGLWDWLELLGIPLVLYFIALSFNRRQESSRRRIEAKRVQESAFQSYIDRITDLLLSNDTPLAKSDKGHAVRDVAKVRTLIVLQQLDSSLRSMLLKFIYEADLIKIGDPVLDLANANFNGVVLQNSTYEGVHLSQISLNNSNLSGVTFCDSDLSGVELKDSILRRAIFRKTSLAGATLVNADIRGVVFEKTSLAGTTFGKNLFDSSTDFSEAANIEYAIGLEEITG